jgi:hypothetical protein
MNDNESKGDESKSAREAEYFWRFRGIDFVRRPNCQIYEPISSRGGDAENAHSEPKIPLVMVRNERSWFDIGVAFSGWLIALATVLILAMYTYYTKGQWMAAIQATNTASRSFNEARNDFRIDERAWIGVSDMLLNKSKAPNPISVQVTVYNTGKTVARNMRTWYFLHLDKHTLPNIEEYVERPIERKDGISSPSVLFPNRPRYLVPVDRISNETRDAVVRGETLLYVIGEIDYDDLFGTTHYTEFCAIFNSHVQAFTDCDSFNDAN